MCQKHQRTKNASNETYLFGGCAKNTRELSILGSNEPYLVEMPKLLERYEA